MTQYWSSYTPVYSYISTEHRTRTHCGSINTVTTTVCCVYGKSLVHPLPQSQLYLFQILRTRLGCACTVQISMNASMPMNMYVCTCIYEGLHMCVFADISIRNSLQFTLYLYLAVCTRAFISACTPTVSDT